MYRNRWSGVVPVFYPQFSDGWRYPGVNMDDIGVSLPSATSAASSQQVLTVVVVAAVAYMIRYNNA